MMPRISESQFRPFTLVDRKTIEPFFRRAPLGLCEYSFAVQFCWHPYNASMWAIIDGMLVIRFTVDGRDRFVCPVGDGDRRPLIDALMDWQISHGSRARIDFVPGSVACGAPGDGLVAHHDPENDDYIYLASDLATLPGRRYAQKRNHIAALSRVSRWSVEPLGVDAPVGALCDFVTMWADGRDASAGSMMAHESEAMIRALTNAGNLGLDVFTLTVDGACAGISVGEQTAPDTYTIHFEKSLAGIRGAYQAICSGVAARVADRCMWINREQDLGIEGLRRTKRSWNPARMEKCLTIMPSGRT